MPTAMKPFDKIKTQKAAQMSDLVQYIKDAGRKILSDTFLGFIRGCHGSNDYGQFESFEIEDLEDDYLDECPENMSEDECNQALEEDLEFLKQNVPDFNNIQWDIWTDMEKHGI